MGGVFVAGEPVLSGGRGQDEWLAALRAGVAKLPQKVKRPKLTFVVSGLRRNGQFFDLDNLMYAPLDVMEEPLDSVSVRLHVGDRPGVLIEDGDPSTPGVVLKSIYVERHSIGSQKTRVGIPEIGSDPVFNQHEGIGQSIEFDRTDIPIRRGWFGPTEAVIDDLAPWLGRYQTRGLIADHRIRDLRLTRGVKPDSHGARISIWYVPDSEIPVPDELLDLTRI
jgi:hypothetical protein